MNMDANVMVQMARSVGLDFSNELQGDIRKTWDKLNNLYESSTEAYNAFIQDQLQGMKEQSFPDKSDMNFVVKTRLLANKDKQVLLYIKQHASMKMPFHSDGRVVEKNDQHLCDLEIPMAISDVRQMKDASGFEVIALDVVMNTWCLLTAACNSQFKVDLIRLILKSIAEEHGLEVQRNWEITSMAKDPKLSTSTCDPSCTEHTEEDDKPLDAMRDPSTLIRSLQSKVDNTGDSVGYNLKPTSTSKKVLVQDVTKSHKKTTRPLAKTMKGFLNNAKDYKPIYDQPSSGDGKVGTGGSFSRLISKCQVVDTNSPTTPNHSTSNTKVIPSDEVEKEVEMPLRASYGGSVSRKNKENDNFDKEFDNMMKKVDPEFAISFEDPSECTVSKEEEALKALQLIESRTGRLGIDSNQSLAEGLTNESKVSANCDIPTISLPVERPHVRQKQVKYSSEWKKGVLTVIIDLLDTKVQSSDIQLEIEGDKMTLETSHGTYFRFIHPKVSVENAIAKFNKKQKVLKVTFK